MKSFGISARMLASVVLAASTVVLAVPASPVRALTYPAANDAFPVCAASDQEFCIEKYEFTPTNGALIDLTNVSFNQALLQYAAFAVRSVEPYTGMPEVDITRIVPPARPPSMPQFAMSFSNVETGTLPDGTTKDGLPDGLYRAVVRIGDFDPTFLMLGAKFNSYTISKGADGYFTVDFSIRPTAIAMVSAPSATDMTPIEVCERNKWVTDCEANVAFRRYIMSSLIAGHSAKDREAARGSWVATNASSFSFGRMDPVAGTIEVDAKGPHYVPRDFGVPGLTVENGRELNPASFEMSIPYSLVGSMMSRMAGKDITADQVKELLSKPKEVLEGTIDQVASGSTTVTEKVQEISTTLEEKNVRINFNLTHYSAPNPTLKIKVPSAVATPSAGGAAATPTAGMPAAAASRSEKKLKTGATIKPLLQSITNRRLSAKTLLQLPAGAKVVKMTSSTKSFCSVSGSTLRTLKKGTCRYSVTISHKKKQTKVALSLSVFAP